MIDNVYAYGKPLLSFILYRFQQCKSTKMWMVYIIALLTFWQSTGIEGSAFKSNLWIPSYTQGWRRTPELSMLMLGQCSDE